ncbi:hypothetical protein, partial [Mesorhizobium sp. M4A.F.Ca.ET.050.02.1.1]|uniref:hypothetical protein n=1 Tax=Mesorhizobium sp. M4A.F.Ca.ET.050.02.1.1 TaxID=2496754 RepID=UPI001AECC1CB
SMPTYWPMPPAMAGTTRPDAIASGSKRHFEEMKLELIAAGYEIVPVGARPRCPHFDALASE